MKLKEAPKKVTIEVTQTDIKKGDQGDMQSCAIARAVKRTMGDSPNVDSLITVEIAGKTWFYDMPQKAANFISKFDEDKSLVKPFSFVAKRSHHEGEEW